jgi:S-disulfanyl-L-cysteine oxidoreductase SoxD
MYRWPEALLLALLLGSAQSGVAAERYPAIGREATAAEIAAWDIDVRPDFLGLPPGSGTVARGRELYAAQCAPCHGEKGESRAIFSPLIGGTTAQDIATGRVQALRGVVPPMSSPLFMRVATVSSVFDYIRRAMPWTTPKSLAPEEVYAVLAYLLNLAAIVSDDFTLSDANIAEVQTRMPNRNGMTTDHGLWPGSGMGNGGRPDVQATACMANCDPDAKPGAVLPPAARGAHGKFDEQNRAFGPVRGTPPPVQP